MDLSTPAEFLDQEEPESWSPQDQQRYCLKCSRDCWETSTQQLLSLGRLTDNDLAGLKRMCKVYGQLQVAEVDIAMRGQNVEMPSKNGPYMQVNPSVATAKSCDDRLRRWYLCFGLVPAGRVKLAPAKAAAVQPEKGGLRGFNATQQAAIAQGDAQRLKPVPKKKAAKKKPVPPKAVKKKAAAKKAAKARKGSKKRVK